MDRESFDVSVVPSGEDWPLLAIDATGAPASVADRLAGPDGADLPAEDVDVTYRETEGDGPGILAVSNRLTGEFLLEARLESSRIAALVEAVLETNDAEDGHYRLELRTDDGTTTYRKETLLVYDADGNLLRGRSLIPGGVEL